MLDLKVVREFIACDSTPSQGSKDIAELAARLCDQAGLHTELQIESADGLMQANLIARPQSERKEGEILFQTHLDTVEPGSYSAWTKTGGNPFEATVSGQELFGLGVAESKLDFLCKLAALKELVGKDLNRSFVLVGSFGEETGMRGALKLVRHKKVLSKEALIGGPTDLRIITQGKGFATIQIEIPFSKQEKELRENLNTEAGQFTSSRIFSGKTAHSSEPASGDSAITKMFESLSFLPKGVLVLEMDGGINYNTIADQAYLEIDSSSPIRDSMIAKVSELHQEIQKLGEKLKLTSCPGFDPPYPTLNVGFVRTHSEGVRMGGSVRLTPNVNETLYSEWMDQLTQFCLKIGARLEIRDLKSSFQTRDDQSQLLSVSRTILQEWGMNSESDRTSRCTEASVFSRFGMNCILFGPGRSSGNVHQPNECVKVDSLRVATLFYRELGYRLCKSENEKKIGTKNGTD